MKFKFLTTYLITISFVFLISNNSYSQEANEVISNNCTCSTEMERSKRYVPPLRLLLKFGDFNTSTEWKFENGVSDFNSLYFDKMLSNSSSYSGNRLSLTIFSSKPIKLIHPNKEFTLNLTPCFNANNYYDVKTSFGHSKQLDYDFDNFDYSAQAYFNLMRVIRHFSSNEEAIKVFWLKKYEYDSENLMSLIKDLNTTYGLKIKPELSVDEYEGIIENLEEKINEIIEQLIHKGVNLSNFILEKYVQTDASSHKINTEEEKNIAAFFYDYRSENFSVSWVEENFLRSNYSGVFYTNKIALEVNSTIIKNKSSNTTTTSILIGTNKISFSNIGSLSINTKDVCQENYEILNTGIHIILKDVTLTAPSANEIKQKIKNTRSKKNGFSGVLIHDATIRIPYKTKKIEAVGNNLRFNNNFISGSFNIYKHRTNLTKQELKKHLAKLGLNEISITEDKDLFTITFNNVSQHQ